MEVLAPLEVFCLVLVSAVFSKAESSTLSELSYLWMDFALGRDAAITTVTHVSS